jgi:hypothetical protein
MENVKEYTYRTIVKISLMIFTFICLIIAAKLLLVVENEVLSLTSSQLKGPNDIVFWTLAIIESNLGLLIAVVFIPKWYKLKQFNKFYSVFEPIILPVYYYFIVAGSIGFALGLSFSGIWKLIRIILYNLYR